MDQSREYKLYTANEGLLRPSYENDWIERGLSKHRSNYSMVVCFETSDPARFEQLKNFFCYSPPEDYKMHKVFIYDPWNGLGTLNKTGDIIPLSELLKEELKGNKLRNLDLVLDLMDTELKNEKTIFIIYNLPREMIKGNIHLISALRSWANSPELILKRSLVILLGTTSYAMLDEETRELITIVDVDIGKDSEYEKLIDYLADTFGIRLSEEEKGVIKSALKGLNLHQAEAILRESYALKGCFDLEQIKISKGQLVKKTGILEIEEPTEDFDSIGGYEEVKDFINNKVIKVLHNPERAETFAIPLPRGILFFGPPGTGKTLFARALAKRVKLPFINFKTENIYSPWLGESGQRMRTAIKIAEQMSPAIVFIDEIDRFGRRIATRDSAGEETRRVFSQLLEWLGKQDRKAIIVGTTNRPEDLDEAFIRTGRFDYRIPILYPDEEARLEILRVHLGLSDKQGRKSPKPKPPLALSDEEFYEFLRREIVPETEGYTGAELEELVTRAKRNAFERGANAVEEEDFRESLKSFRIDRDERARQREYYEELAEKFTDEEKFLRSKKFLK